MGIHQLSQHKYCGARNRRMEDDEQKSMARMLSRASAEIPGEILIDNFRFSARPTSGALISMLHERIWPFRDAG